MNKEFRHNTPIRKLTIQHNGMRPSVCRECDSRKKKKNKYRSSVLLYIMHIRLIDCLQTSSDASHYTAHLHILCAHILVRQSILRIALIINILYCFGG